MRQPASLLVAFSVICCPLTVTVKAQDQALQLGTPIERQLGSGETHTFNVRLQQNQFAELVVDQRGIDVVVRVLAPSGKTLGEFDSPNGDNGPENVSFLATTAGAYHVFVLPLNLNGAVSGKYEIKLVEVRQATEQELKTSKNLELVKAKGIALMGDVEQLIPELHTPATRIRAQMRAAQMLLDVDEKRATKYMNDAVAGVKELVASADPGAEQYGQDYSVITSLRSELVRMLATRDPEAALAFLYATSGLSNPYGNEREQNQQDRSMELMIATQLVAKDPKRTLEVARRDLKKGYSGDLVYTIESLRQKNPELAATLAAEVAAKLLNEKLLKNSQAGMVTAGLINLCNNIATRVQVTDSVAAQTAPLLSEQTCRELAQRAYDEAMSFQVVQNGPYNQEREAAWNLLNSLKSMGPNLDATVDGGVAAVEKRITELNNATNPYVETSQKLQQNLQSGSVDGAMETVQKAPEELRDQLYQEIASSVAAKGDMARAQQILNDNVRNVFQRRQTLRNIAEQEVYQQIARGKVEDALRAIAAVKTPRERANLLMQVVRQIGPGQKRANAINLLEQARTLIAPGVQAQDQEQMYALVQLARAFARYDVKRAFEILDPLVDQLNDLLVAARVLDGFGAQFYANDEFAFDGNNLANLVNEMSTALGALAVINFERAKLTSDRLRLPELRLHAYLDIAEQTIQASKTESVLQGGIRE